MAVELDDPFTGTAGLAISARSPTVGAWTDAGFFFVNLDGSGNAIQGSFNSQAWNTVDLTSNGTLDVVMQSEAGGGVGLCRAYFGAAATLSSGYALGLLSSTSGIELLRNGTQVATHATGYTAGASNTFKVDRLDGNIKVFVNGSGSASIDYTDGSPLSVRRCGIDLTGGGGTQLISSFKWTGLEVTYPKNDNQDTRRILHRVTRSRLFRAA